MIGSHLKYDLNHANLYGIYIGTTGKHALSAEIARFLDDLSLELLELL